MRGARVLAVPAAFTLPTTRDHWEVLLRARAIENQAFVVAANQIGEHPPGMRSGGRSMIVDPWGVVLARRPTTRASSSPTSTSSAQDAIRGELPGAGQPPAAAYAWRRGATPDGVDRAADQAAPPTSAA